MPTLWEREKESYWELQGRLLEREREYGISSKLAEYIEMMEVYLLKLEQRVMELESILDVEY